ncbi:hypothetical protein Hanom_Chr00s000001g01593061 [Helianthus anomalus]
MMNDLDQQYTSLVLNSTVELISHRPSPFANLESLKILPKVYCLSRHKHTRVVMSTEVKNYLLNSSPKATMTEVCIRIYYMMMKINVLLRPLVVGRFFKKNSKKTPENAPDPITPGVSGRFFCSNLLLAFFLKRSFCFVEWLTHQSF